MSCPLQRHHCACRCGYTCGGPGRCPLGAFECLDAGHFKKDCDHKFTGPLVHQGDGMMSIECEACGISAMDHDCAVGP